MWKSIATTWSRGANAASVAAGSPNHVSTSMLSGASVPDQRRLRLHGVFGMQDERQFLIIHHDRLGGIERLGLGFRHHGGDRLADMACLVGGQQQVRADEHRAAARRMQLHVEFGFWQRIVRNGIEPGGQAISPAEGRNDAGQRARGGKVHVTDVRMWMRRPHHRQVTLAGDGKSSLKRPAPVVSRASSLRGSGVPMKRKCSEGLGCCMTGRERALRSSLDSPIRQLATAECSAGVSPAWQQSESQIPEERRRACTRRLAAANPPSWTARVARRRALLSRAMPHEKNFTVQARVVGLK